MTLSRKERVVAAGLGGLAAGYAQMRRLTRDDALAEIRQDLEASKLDGDQAVAVLSDAAARYVDGDQHYDSEALQLLVDAGADVDRARAIRAARLSSGNPLQVLAAQANAGSRPGDDSGAPGQEPVKK